MNHLILQAQSEGGMSFFILIGGMFLIMYFFMIRPQVKKTKRSKILPRGTVERGQSGDHWWNPWQSR
jgi:preprotein translocase subunit YajC